MEMFKKLAAVAALSLVAGNVFAAAAEPQKLTGVIRGAQSNASILVERGLTSDPATLDAYNKRHPKSKPTASADWRTHGGHSVAVLPAVPVSKLVSYSDDEDDKASKAATPAADSKLANAIDFEKENREREERQDELERELIASSDSDDDASNQATNADASDDEYDFEDEQTDVKRPSNISFAKRNWVDRLTAMAASIPGANKAKAAFWAVKNHPNKTQVLKDMAKTAVQKAREFYQAHPTAVNRTAAALAYGALCAYNPWCLIPGVAGATYKGFKFVKSKVA